MTEHTLSRNGCPLHYWLAGEAGQPLVVFTHGAGCDHCMFEAQVAALAGMYRTLTWDVRGHGLSRPMGEPFSVRGAVADLLAILDDVGVDEAVFVGQSMGGNIGQELVFLYPERVKALVMVGCTCNTLKLSRSEQFALGITPPLLHLYPYETLKRQSGRASSVTPEGQAYLYEAFSRIPKADFVAIFLATANCLHYEPEYRIAKPLLLTHGSHDGTGNIRKVAPVWAAREPCCQYKVILDAGHVANMDNPDFFNSLLLHFLQTLDDS